MLLQRLLGRDRIEKELAFVFLFLRAAAVAARLRHVIAPFVIELGQLIEFRLEISSSLVVGFSAFLPLCRSGSVGQFFQDRIGFHLLLHEVAQLEQRRLKNEKALLKLRREDLLQRQILRLMHSWAGHNNYEGKLRTTRGKQFSSRAGESRSKIARECDLLSKTTQFLG